MAKKKKGYSKAAHVMSLPLPSAPKGHGLDRYDIEDAARTMKRNQEIKANPKLHRAAKSHLKREMALAHRAVRGK